MSTVSQVRARGLGTESSVNKIHEEKVAINSQGRRKGLARIVMTRRGIPYSILVSFRKTCHFNANKCPEEWRTSQRAFEQERKVDYCGDAGRKPCRCRRQEWLQRILCRSYVRSVVFKSRYVACEEVSERAHGGSDQSWRCDFRAIIEFMHLKPQIRICPGSCHVIFRPEKMPQFLLI